MNKNIPSCLSIVSYKNIQKVTSLGTIQQCVGLPALISTHSKLPELDELLRWMGDDPSKAAQLFDLSAVFYRNTRRIVPGFSF